ncbi:hypothetical protein, partial [Kineococcus vitellinus]|uniref:hypothetical protein n=1 Tax=Kineococcus vitellinus TaxID=2696565 RepID=UPI00196B43A1
RLGDAVGLNAAAGPFDHAAFARQQHAFWGEEVSDPYFGRADVEGADADSPDSVDNAGTGGVDAGGVDGAADSVVGGAPGRPGGPVVKRR